MPEITLRQYLGNTEPRSINVTVKDSPLTDPELDNNFNNINNAIEYNTALTSTVFESSNNKLSIYGGNITGNVTIIGTVTANNIDCGIF